MFQSFSPFGQFQSFGPMLQGQFLQPPQQQYFPRPQFVPAVAVTAPVSVPVVVTVNETFVFMQVVASATWTINHTFAGQFPSVTIADINGNVVLANVQYTAGLDQVIVTFADPFAGTAYLNV